MRLVPDQRAVEQFVAAGLDPPFHDRVHAGNLDAAEHGRDAGVGEDRVEQGGVLAIPVTDDVRDLTSGVLDVHGEVACGLCYPGRGWMGGGPEDAYPAGGVLDDGQDVESGAVQRGGFEEVGGADGV